MLGGKTVADKYCDLVMKGGITSGIVYPNAVLALAREYRFKSIGGRFSNYVLCGGEHQDLFDCSYLTELMNIAGFKRVQRVDVHETCYSDVFDHNVLATRSERNPELPHNLVVEAIKVERAIPEEGH